MEQEGRCLQISIFSSKSPCQASQLSRELWAPSSTMVLLHALPRWDDFEGKAYL